MQAHIIENNKIVNTIEVDSLSFAPNLIDASLGGNIGDLWLGGTSFQKVDPESLADKRARIWDEIKKYRDSLVQNGGYKVGVHWFHSDTFSRTQQMSLVMMGANMPSGIQWKTMDNGYVLMTPTLAGQIFAAAAASDAAMFAKAVEHKNALDLSSDPDSYNWRMGWPQIYQRG